MNKEYICTNGKVIIIDEKGAKPKTPHYDNIDAILVQENIIETIKN